MIHTHSEGSQVSFKSFDPVVLLLGLEFPLRDFLVKCLDFSRSCVVRKGKVFISIESKRGVNRERSTAKPIVLTWKRGRSALVLSRCT